MGSATPTLYPPSNDVAPVMVLPEHVDGIIDLKTLVDIHRFLSESELEDDLVLARWVKDRYLYEPMIEEGRPIRTAQGFSQLDRAYRRVRSLTNKAQDKWPFFDRAWKSMSSTTVKNNARGEAAPGVSLPGIRSELPVAPIPTEPEAHIETPAASEPFLPFARKQPRRTTVLKLKQRSQPSQDKPVTGILTRPSPAKESSIQHSPSSEIALDSLNPSKPIDQSNLSPSSPQPTDQSCNLQGETDPQSEQRNSVSVRIEPQGKANSDNATELGMASDSQDAGHGKVRGQNGRYMPKSKSPPSVKPERKSTRGAKQNKTVRLSTADLEVAETPEASPAESVKNSNETDGDDTATFTVEHNEGYVHKDVNEDGSVGEGPDASGPTNINKSDSSSNPSESTTSSPLQYTTPNGSTPAYTLAAEADPVVSNLDKLPPAAMMRKRKSESVPAHVTPRKRGRPSSLQKQNKEATKSSEQQSSKIASVTNDEETPKMLTRRTLRQSTAASFDVPTPVKAKPENTSSKKQKKDSISGDHPTVDVDTDITTIGLEVTPVAEDKSVSARAVNIQLQTPVSPSETSPRLPDVNLPSPNIPSKKPAPKQAKVSKPTKKADTAGKRTTKAKKGGSRKSNLGDDLMMDGVEMVTDLVQFFARVQGPNGEVEIPIPRVPREKFDTEVRLIKKYANWVAAHGWEYESGNIISFNMFKSIYEIAGE